MPEQEGIATEFKQNIAGKIEVVSEFHGK